MTRPGLAAFFRPSDSFDFLRRTSPDFFGASLLIRMLEETGESGGLGGLLSEALSSGRARNFSEALAQLNPTDRESLQNRWGRSLAEIESLSHERDPQIFYAGVLQIGQRLEDNDQLEQAGVVYSAIVAGNSPQPPLTLRGGEDRRVFSGGGGEVPPLRIRGGQEGLAPVPAEIRQRAQVRLNAMTGVGASGERLAFLARRISTEATRPDMLLAMGAAGATFRLARLASTARLAGTLETAWGLRAATYGSAFLAETVAFTGIGKVAGAAFGYQQDWSPEAVFHEWAGGATMLLGLKLTGALAGAAAQRYARGPGVLERFTQVALPQVGMFGGILLGNRLEEAAGFRTHREGDTWLVDGLSTLLQFNVAGRLQPAALGEGFARFERRLDLHTELLARTRPGASFDSIRDFFTPDLVTPEGIRVPSFGNRKSEIENLSGPVFMVGEGEGGPRAPASSGGGASASRSFSREQVQRFFSELLERGKKEEVGGFKNFLFSNFREISGHEPGEILDRYHRSHDVEEWRRLIRIGLGLLDSRPEARERLERHAEFGTFVEDWLGRPHYRSSEEVMIKFDSALGSVFNLSKQFHELQKAMVESPSLRRFQAFSQVMTGRGKAKGARPFEAVGVRESQGGMAFVGNWGKAGFVVRFSPQGFLSLPIEVRRPFGAGEIQSKALELRKGTAVSAPNPVVSQPVLPLELLPATGENPSQWAMRLLQASRGADDSAQLRVALALESVLRNPKSHSLGMETVDRFRSLIPLERKEGEGILVRDYTLPGLEKPLRILSLPTTFLPENWSLFFAKRVVAEIERNGGQVGRAMEIGSGTGWLSIYLAKRGMVREMTGVDTTASAPIVSRINAILNGVEGVEFFQSDLLSALPPERKADLLVACIPQIPSSDPLSERQFADSYPERDNVARPHGLGLIFDALRQSLPRMSEDGRVLFNLAGRPGLEILKEMYRRAGFSPAIRHHEIIPQDPTTSIEPLASLEARYGVQFEFLDPHSDRVLKAQEALGVEGIRHHQYLIEGIPYSHYFQGAAREVFQNPSRWGYTPDPGSEHPPLHSELLSFLKGEWGTEFSPETLFVGPEQGRVLGGMLRTVLPLQGRLLWVGEAQEDAASLGTALEGIRQEQVSGDLQALRNSLAAEPADAVVLNLGRTRWILPEQHRALAELLELAAQQKTPLFFIENHPTRLADGVHPLMRALQGVPEARPYTTVLQSLDERFQLSAFPLTAAMVGNASLYRSLLRLAELDYSRVSTPSQAVYAKFLNQVSTPVSILPSGLGSFNSVAGEDLRSPLASILNQAPPFESLPRARHADPIDMSFGESEWTLPLDLGQALTAAAARGQDFSAASTATQEAVVTYLRETRGVVYEPSQIVLGRGVQPLLGSVIEALREKNGGRGPRVVVPHPSYGLFFPTVEAAGGRLEEVPTYPQNRYLLDADTLDKKISFASRTLQALLINSPTNPAGQYYSEAQLRELSRVLRRNQAYLLFDDVFGMLNLQTKPQQALSPWAVAQGAMQDHLLGFGGLSKEFAAGGLRFGFVAATDPEILGFLRKNASPSPDPLSLAAAQEILPRWGNLIEEHRNYLNYRKRMLEGFFLERGLDVTETQGGFALYVNLRPLFGRRVSQGVGRSAIVSSGNLHELLMSQAGIRIHSDAWARVPNNYRFIYSIDRIDEAISRLRKFFQGLR